MLVLWYTPPFFYSFHLFKFVLSALPYSRKMFVSHTHTHLHIHTHTLLSSFSLKKKGKNNCKKIIRGKEINNTLFYPSPFVLIKICNNNKKSVLNIYTNTHTHFFPSLSFNLLVHFYVRTFFVI